MLKALSFKILLLFLPFAGMAQWAEVGLFAGGSNFIGDVGNYGIHLPQGYAGGAFFRYNFNRHWSVRAGGNYGFIKADDAMSGRDWRNNRNLSFQSEIWEAYAVAEFNYFEFEPGSPYWHTPYLVGGFGLFWFNPKAELNGDLYELQPLGTEGQGTEINPNAPYALASSYFCFGMGYKFAINRLTTISVESTFRHTNTDYLDDVSGLYPNQERLEQLSGELTARFSDRSLTDGDKEFMQRGNPDNTDWYIFTGITLQIKFEEIYEKCANFVR